MGHAQTPQMWLELEATTSNVFLQTGLGAGNMLGSLTQQCPHTDGHPDDVSAYTGLIHTKAKMESLGIW